MSKKQLQHLCTLLPVWEAFQKDTPGYKEQCEPWSVWADKHPKLVLQPTSADSLSKVVKALYDSDLDFAIRGTGTGSASAKDVVLSTQGLKHFSFDKQSETVTIGSGFCWGEVDQLMEEQAPGYQVPSARCTWVGVAGSTLVGGLSWLSHEFGVQSDPQNTLDMQVVLGDGRLLWASEEPDLLWALRGGGGNFAVVTALKLRARRYTDKIFTGLLFFPYSSLKAISKAVAEMAARPADPKVAMHVMNQGSALGTPAQGAKPGIAIMMYDAHGEEHGRSDEGFGCFFKIPDCQQVACRETTLKEVNQLAGAFKEWQGNNMFWLSAPLIDHVDDDTLVRAWKWWEDTINLHPGFDVGSTVLLEYMQENAMNSSGGRSKTGWPHSGRRHVMQLVLGCKPEGAPSNIREIVMKQFAKAGPQISGPNGDTKEFHAGFLHEFNNLDEVYGENLPRLKVIKKKYDSRNRFNKGVDLANEKVQKNATV